MQATQQRRDSNNMPELPEVETTARFIRANCLNRTITKVQVLWQRSVATPSAKVFSRRLLGAKVMDVLRLGKFVVIRLDPAAFLLGHMRMSGSFSIERLVSASHRHTRVVFTFDDESALRFIDPRKFGRFYLINDLNEVSAALGPDALDSALTPDRFIEMVKSKSGAIKPLLLKQSFIAGIGNIYADESLWLTGIHPLRKCAELQPKQVKRLLRAIRSILRRAISKGGTDSGDGVVDYGSFNPRVYGREGKQCKRCRGIIRRIVVGQRGTHYCPGCQKLKRSKGIK